MFVNKGYYNTSTDYKKLFDLLCEGQTIICLITNLKDKVCIVKRFSEFHIHFDIPEINFLQLSNNKKLGKTEFKLFKIFCKEQNIKWVTNNGINSYNNSTAPELLGSIMVLKINFEVLHYQNKLSKEGEILYQKTLNVIEKLTTNHYGTSSLIELFPYATKLKDFIETNKELLTTDYFFEDISQYQFEVIRSDDADTKNELFLKSNYRHYHNKESVKDLLNSDIFRETNYHLVPIYEKALEMMEKDYAFMVYL